MYIIHSILWMVIDFKVKKYRTIGNQTVYKSQKSITLHVLVTLTNKQIQRNEIINTQDYYYFNKPNSGMSVLISAELNRVEPC